MAVKINNATHDINPAFYGLWVSKAGHILAKGGRSSTKSSTISKKLVEKHEKYPMSNAVLLRQYENTILKSVYSQTQWALIEAGVYSRYQCTKRPMQIINRNTGTGFYFSGGNEPEKLKSLKIPVGYVGDVWFEEMDSFSGEAAIDTIEDTFIRNYTPDGQRVTMRGSWNPPRNPYHWINEYVEKHRNNPDFYIHHSTYLDDIRGFNSPQIIEKIQRYAENDPDYYRWMYLGEVIGMGDNVYNMSLFHTIKDLEQFKSDPIVCLCYASDTGHQVSATTCLCIGITQSGCVILLDTYYYSPAGRPTKKAPSELAADLKEFIARTSRDYPVRIAQRTIDSAEGGLRNQYFLDYGIRWHPINKLAKADMIDHVHDLLAQGRVYVLDTKAIKHADGAQMHANDVFITEHKQYEWKPKTLNTAHPDVVKEKDHTCDAFQYFVIDNAALLGLVIRR